ncbi:hypothetical protein M9H77_27531 [Catharanthus roseus]|uniref:Uncharacterized protein n=1 Tax=Catharanthus roseus TaxID=4058 RepID=A0ACC0ACR7_CATRO|nr:hypothetical protein M9H77_27531 [Catharanthus roseus]
MHLILIKNKFYSMLSDPILMIKISKDKESIGLKEISKKVSRWSYKLITDLEQQSGEYPENILVQHQIRSRKAKNIVIFTANKENPNSNTNNKDTNASDPRNEVALPYYSQQSDFRRGIIKGSMRAQRHFGEWKLNFPLVLPENTIPFLNPFLRNCKQKLENSKGLRKVSELNETKNEKDSRISNQIIHELFSLIQSPNWTNSSLTKKRQ